jgi:hypothetical protein
MSAAKQVSGAPSAAIRAAKEALIEATGRYYIAIAEAFPVGSFVTNLKNGRVRCEVLGHSGERLLIHSNQSGKRYWIDVFHVEEAQLWRGRKAPFSYDREIAAAHESSPDGAIK